MLPSQFKLSPELKEAHNKVLNYLREWVKNNLFTKENETLIEQIQKFVAKIVEIINSFNFWTTTLV